MNYIGLVEFADEVRSALLGLGCKRRRRRVETRLERLSVLVSQCDWLEGSIPIYDLRMIWRNSLPHNQQLDPICRKGSSHLHHNHRLLQSKKSSMKIQPTPYPKLHQNEHSKRNQRNHDCRRSDPQDEIMSRIADF